MKKIFNFFISTLKKLTLRQLFFLFFASIISLVAIIGYYEVAQVGALSAFVIDLLCILIFVLDNIIFIQIVNLLNEDTNKKK